MKSTRRIVLGTLVLGCWLAAAGTRSAATVTCQDGTTSKSGRGACSHHGGVANAAETETRTPTAQKNAPAAAVTCQDGTTSKAGRGACSHHGGIAAAGTPPATVPTSPGAPKSPTAEPSASARAGATAQCKDGTYSHAQHHQGACSRHGGVAQWLDER